MEETEVVVKGLSDEDNNNDEEGRVEEEEECFARGFDRNQPYRQARRR